MKRERVPIAKPKSELRPATMFHHPQNILLYQEKFPLHVFEGDKVQVVYSDRLDQNEFYEALRKHLGDRIRGHELDYCSDAEGLRGLVEEVLREDLTGFRVVKHTSGTGYSIYRFDGFVKGKSTPERELYTGQDAPNVSIEDSTYSWVTEEI